MATTPLATSSFPYPCPSPPLSKTLNPSSKCKPPLLAVSFSVLTSPVPLLLPRRRRGVSRRTAATTTWTTTSATSTPTTGRRRRRRRPRQRAGLRRRLRQPPRARQAAALQGGRPGGGGHRHGRGRAEGFVSTQESASDTVVDYAVDEDEFHKIRLLRCDFLIRKVPDPDDDVFDFREMYVTPPDTDIYSIPRVLAPMPHKYVRCAKKNFGRYHVSEPPVEHLRDPLYKTEGDYEGFLNQTLQKQEV